MELLQSRSVALALWNGRDPILKERLFGLTNSEGNHGEDVKEYRTRSQLEYELLDTGVFDGDRYFDVFVEYAKAGPNDLLIQVTVWNRGPEPASLLVLPTLWFRNVWSWGGDAPRPVLSESAGSREALVIAAAHPGE